MFPAASTLRFRCISGMPLAVPPMAEEGLPSGYVKIAIENGPVEIVSFSIFIAWWIFP